MCAGILAASHQMEELLALLHAIIMVETRYCLNVCHFVFQIIGERYYKQCKMVDERINYHIAVIKFYNCLVENVVCKSVPVSNSVLVHNGHHTK